jgi:hypothetical protein
MISEAPSRTMKRKRQRLAECKLTEQEEHQLRVDLQLVSARFPKGERLPLWPVSSFGKKRVFGSVHFYEDHLSIGPTRRVVDDYALLFGCDWSDKISEMARSETHLSFDHRLPFAQWARRAKQLPIKAWAAFVRQEAQVKAWAKDFRELQVSSVSWDTDTKSAKPSYRMSLADVTFLAHATPTMSGCAWRRTIHIDPAVELSVQFSDIEQSVLAWFAEVRACLSLIFVEPLAELVSGYIHVHA